MFTIELLVIRNGTDPVVIDRMTSTASQLADADRVAKVLLEKVQRVRTHNQPDRIGYRIIDGVGTVVLRSLGATTTMPTGKQ